ncbi:MAG TPA: tetratricopeptide repeat protein [Pyrinomonadaceae bacterium]|nr:tetratricopeptide repeat protein [Pyrinomonadaceae bacterium]
MTETTKRTLAATAALALLTLAPACRGGDSKKGEGQQGSASNAAANPAGAQTADSTKLDANIGRLEKLAEKNPADEDTRQLLARAYVMRANAHRTAGRTREALEDYRRAQRLDLDNEEAIKNISELSPQVEGTPQEGEYGEPPPLPVNPNVTGGEEGPTPTPKKP